ncbi:MAG: GxxExxY protein [Candidatus Angelobacter sp.]
MSEAAAKLAMKPTTANEISHGVISAALKVHSALGPGLLESVYEACLAHELRKMELKVDTQVGLPVIYDGIKLDLGYRIDMLVNDLVVIELKSVEEISRIHVAQVLSYMKLSKKQLGLIINFNVLHLKDGIKRLVEGTGWK